MRVRSRPQLTDAPPLHKGERHVMVCFISQLRPTAQRDAVRPALCASVRSVVAVGGLVMGVMGICPQHIFYA